MNNAVKDGLGMELSKSDFARFSELVFRKSGIHLVESKMELLRSRLSRRLRALSMGSFNAYYQRVVEDPTGEELTQMVESVTTHKTEFFRESEHFDHLAKSVSVWSGDKGCTEPVRLWSAACSSVEEAYSMAMTALEAIQGRRQLKVLGTDLSNRILARAMDGHYGAHHAASIPKPLLAKYFRPDDRGPEPAYRPEGALRHVVYFAPLNLNDDYPFCKPFDAIFCRNVMIYFNRSTQKRVVEKLAATLKPGGYLYTGLSESLLGTPHPLEMVAPSVYRKS